MIIVQMAGCMLRARSVYNSSSFFPSPSRTARLAFLVHPSAAVDSYTSRSQAAGSCNVQAKLGAVLSRTSLNRRGVAGDHRGHTRAWEIRLEG